MNKNTKRFLSLALASTIVAGVPATVAHAEDTSVEALEEAATNTENYIVKDGDTLGKIAEKYYGNAGFWEMLADYNHLEDPNALAIGQIITVPKDPNLLFDFGIEETYAEDKTYTVKTGDTLYCIVRVQYGLTNQEAVDKLATYNGLSDPNRLSVGQVLLIPEVDKLMQVVQNDYTAEYNRMGWILNHPNGCKPCEIKPDCNPFVVIPTCEPPMFIPTCPAPNPQVIIIPEGPGCHHHPDMGHCPVLKP